MRLVIRRRIDKLVSAKQKLMNITIIGAGNMGGALARGWAGTRMHRVTVTARSEETLARYAGITGIGYCLKITIFARVPG